MQNVLATDYFAAIYVRVSTTDQAEKGFSIPSQIEACRKRAIELGANNIIEYVDDISGGDWDRPALNDLRDDIRSGKVNMVICFDPDRFARNLMHQLIITDEIEKAGCRLEFINFEWKNTPEGKLFYSMRGAISEYEREKIKERTMRGKMQKARSGKVVVPQQTIGLIWDSEREVYRKDPERARVVKNIMKWMAYEKLSTREIATRLNDLGVPAPGAGTKKNKRGTWCKKTVGKVIQNLIYIGEYYFNRYKHIKKVTPDGRKVKNLVERPREEWILIPVEPIIDRELFEAANKQLKVNQNKSSKVKRYYLLRGLLKCSKCGRNFGATTGSAGRHYRCYGTTKDAGKVCDSGTLNAEKVERIIWDTVKQALKDPDKLLAQIKQSQEGFEEQKTLAESELMQIEKGLQTIEEKKQEIMSLFRADLITKDEVSNELSLLKKKADSLAQLKTRSQRIIKVEQISKQNAEIIKNTCREVSAFIDGEITEQQKREILELFINEIVVTVDKSYSSSAPIDFIIDGMLQIKKLHRETSIVGEVPQTYVNLGGGLGFFGK